MTVSNEGDESKIAEDSVPLQDTETSQIGVPIQLKIPRINVDANILKMGIDPLGNMETPEKVGELGWYKHGANPGNVGTAVIAGHLGIGALEKGIFKNLNELRKGDILFITDDRGVIISFKVVGSKIYDRKDHPTEVFKSKDGKAHLNLITCTGTWIKSEQTLSKRLIVFTDKVE